MWRYLVCLLAGLFFLGFAASGGAAAKESESPAPAAERREVMPARFRPALEGALPLRDSIMDVAKQRTEPFRIFDNLYYVGIQWVSCYVLETSAGLVLIDSLHPPHHTQIPDKLARLGLAPSDIRYVLVTHGHFDHAGGARYFQEEYDATVVLMAEDWDLVEDHAANIPAFSFPPPRRDLVAEDGQVLALGDTIVRLYHTPGHTPGTMSIEFMVADGGHEYRAFVMGGAGTNFVGVGRARGYLDSVERIRALAGENRPVEVNLANHPFGNELFERRVRLSMRAEGAHHPFVDADAFAAYLDGLARSGQRRLDTELERR